MAYTPRYFTLKELCSSTTASAKGIDNFPDFTIAARLLRLTEYILDPLRAAWGSAIIVNSGYRCKALNSAVGGSSTSVHVLGWAADLVPANGKIEEFIAFVKEWVKTAHIKFDQLIDEKDSKGNRWLHIGMYGSFGQQRGQIIQKTKL